MATRHRASTNPYRARRDFSRTPEPRGTEEQGEAPRVGLRFVVQKHDASRLHYDLRLEVDGVLKSWAVPRGPSMDPSERRLAVQTEDHPLAYASFEGTIPAGEYGGGTMLVWDTGQFLPESDPAASIARGRLTFVLEGSKLHGRFHLVRVASNKPNDRLPTTSARPRPAQWLLIKSRDQAANPGVDVTTLPEASVLTGRSLDAVGRVVPVPAFLEPQLCTPSTAPPGGSGWLHEPKLDGYRMLARKDGNRVQLFTRSGLDWTSRFPSIARAVARLPTTNVWLDGEAVALEGHGPSFHALQRALAGEALDVPLALLVFDCLFVDGRDVRALPLLERKMLLESLFSVRASPHGREDECLQRLPFSDEDAGRFLDRMDALGLEGMVSKRADAPYEAGRSGSWVKVRLLCREEFVVVGFSPLRTAAPRAEPTVGALLVAGPGAAPGTLVFRGRVGSGYTDRDRRELHALLMPLGRDAKQGPSLPLPRGARGNRGPIRWVEPSLIVEVSYRELTADGLLRQSVFEGIRRDKTTGGMTGGTTGGSQGSAKERSKALAKLLGPSLLPGAVRDEEPAEAPAEAALDVVAGVRISNADRVVYPATAAGAVELTKVDVARYIEAVAPLMLPHVAGRPLAVVRCPDGVRGPSFYQKHLTLGMPADIHSIAVQEQEGEAPEPQLVVDDGAGLVSLVQMGVLEIHPWGVAPRAPDRPDRLIFDLDPAEDRAWSDVVRAAREVRQRLRSEGLESFVKTTGGKGLHVVAPLDGNAGWPDVRAFARDLAATMAADSPRAYTTNMRKDARRGRVFIDHLRNARGSTAIAPWSMRRREGAPVAVPVSWDELDDVRADRWTVLTLHERIGAGPDPWDAYFKTQQSIPAVRGIATL